MCISYIEYIESSISTWDNFTYPLLLWSFSDHRCDMYFHRYRNRTYLWCNAINCDIEKISINRRDYYIAIKCVPCSMFSSSSSAGIRDTHSVIIITSYIRLRESKITRRTTVMNITYYAHTNQFIHSDWISFHLNRSRRKFTCTLKNGLIEIENEKWMEKTIQKAEQTKL